MNSNEIRDLNTATVWARGDVPAEAKVLLHEIERQRVEYKDGQIHLEKPPEDRIHKCVDLNAMKMPVAWVEYDEKYGYFLTSVNLYGDGTITDIKFCPFCGEKLNAAI